MSVFGFLLILITVINCNNFIKEYKNILQLTQPVASIRSNQICPIPVAYGIRVYDENENLEIINILP